LAELTRIEGNETQTAGFQSGLFCNTKQASGQYDILGELPPFTRSANLDREILLEMSGVGQIQKSLTEAQP
jgi:hypothetical protein